MKKEDKEKYKTFLDKLEQSIHPEDLENFKAVGTALVQDLIDRYKASRGKENEPK
jgi:hypothetical protein